MSNAITQYVETLDDLQRTAKLLAVSGYFDAKGDSPQAIAQLAAKLMAGREMGYGPFASVNGIHVIQGKPTIGANLMAAAVKSHPRYNYRVKTMTNDLVEIEFYEDGQSLGIESFSMDDAKAAKLTEKDNWKKFPRNMLFARCMSNGVRFRCPDVFNGNTVYVPEELGADVDPETGEILEGNYTVQPPAPQAHANGNGTAKAAQPEDNPFKDEQPDIQTQSAAILDELRTTAKTFAQIQAAAHQWAAAQPKWKHADHLENAWTMHQEMKPEKVTKENAESWVLDWITYVLNHEAGQTVELEPTK